jgi:hypothetical protein
MPSEKTPGSAWRGVQGYVMPRDATIGASRRRARQRSRNCGIAGIGEEIRTSWGRTAHPEGGGGLTG